MNNFIHLHVMRNATAKLSRLADRLSPAIAATLLGKSHPVTLTIECLASYIRPAAVFTVKDFLATLKTRGLYNYCITQTTTETPNEENKEAYATNYLKVLNNVISSRESEYERDAYDSDTQNRLKSRYLVCYNAYSEYSEHTNGRSDGRTGIASNIRTQMAEPKIFQEKTFHVYNFAALSPESWT